MAGAVTNTFQGSTLAINGTTSTGVAGTRQAQNIVENVNISFSLTSGSGSGKVNLPPLVVPGLDFSGSLGASASDTIDFTSYKDYVGNSVTTMTKLRKLVITNTGTTTLEIGGAASNAIAGAGFLKDTSDVFSLKGGDSLVIMCAAGITVSATIKSLKILNTDGAVGGSYSILAEGGST